MAKASIFINDSFVVRFPKRKEEGSEPYPECLLEHFLSSPHRINLDHKGITGNYMNWQYQFDPAADPFYLLEMQLEFKSRNNNIKGGYHWPISAPEDKTNLSFADFNLADEDDLFNYVSVHISGDVSWDFKPTHFAEIQEYMDKNGSGWEEVAMGLRMTFRDNYLWKQGGFPEYTSNADIPTADQTINNLPFILDRMPKSFCVLEHRDPNPMMQWEIDYKHWTKLSDKNVKFGGKFLSPFNP